MTTKLPISAEYGEFEIYQEMFDNDKVYIKLDDFSKYKGSFEVKNGHLVLGIKHELFERLVESWSKSKHLFETEFLELVHDIEALLAELDEEESGS